MVEDLSISPKKVLICAMIWRVTAVWIVRTSHVPDEYWQSLEVAHKLTFGFGYLTWEWRTAIRSYIYPLVIAVLYRVLELLKLDSPDLIILTPRILHAVLSAYADYRFYVWSKSTWATLALLVNWYWYYCATRTLTNTLETALTTIALSTFPWNTEKISESSKNCRFLWIVGLLCAIRPTAAVTWLPLCIYHILSNSKNIPKLLFEYVFITITTLLYSLAVDSFCYERVVFTPWNFFKINILTNVAEYYGTHDSMWYIIVALPVLLGLLAIILPVAAYQIVRDKKIGSQEFMLTLTIIWTLLVYSLMKHKEYRFILPILPMMIFVCNRVKVPKAVEHSEKTKKVMIGVFLLTNLIPMLYFSLVHLKGPLVTMETLREELKDFGVNERKFNPDVLFLTPCHALPLYSHIHKNVTTRFLTCEPNLEGVQNYVDEADLFFEDPLLWLREEFGFQDPNLESNELKNVPGIIIVLDDITDEISEFLENYRRVEKIFHSHVPQSNYGENIFVYKHKSLES